MKPADPMVEGLAAKKRSCARDAASKRDPMLQQRNIMVESLAALRGSLARLEIKQPLVLTNRHLATKTA